MLVIHVLVCYHVYLKVFMIILKLTFLIMFVYVSFPLHALFLLVNDTVVFALLICYVWLLNITLNVTKYVSVTLG